MFSTESDRSEDISCARQKKLEESAQHVTEAMFNKHFVCFNHLPKDNRTDTETFLQRPKSRHAVMCAAFDAISQRGKGNLSVAAVANDGVLPLLDNTLSPPDCSIKGHANVVNNANNCCPGMQSNLLFNNQTRRR
jgi:hypothetical protein